MTTRPEWIDLHTHLDMLKEGPESAIAAAKIAGVTRMITIACHPKDNAQILLLAKTHYPTVFCSLGVHPHDAILFNPEVEESIRVNARELYVVAIGETGLDYHYNRSPHDIQKEAFRKQMQIAEDLNLPVQIHTRDAEEDTVLILKEFAGRVRGIIHCFTGTQFLADEALKIGFNISFSGVLTFKSAEALRTVARTVPLDRMHVETDAPFLTPIPFRGKVDNSPAMVIHTARVLAGLKGVSELELSRHTQENANRMFSKLK